MRSLYNNCSGLCAVWSCYSVLLWGLYKVFKSCSLHCHINSHVLFIWAGGCVCVWSCRLLEAPFILTSYTWISSSHTQRLDENVREKETALQEVHQEHLVPLMLPKLHAGTYTFNYTWLSFLKRTVFQIKSWFHDIRSFRHKNNLISLFFFFVHFYCSKTSRYVEFNQNHLWCTDSPQRFMENWFSLFLTIT